MARSIQNLRVCINASDNCNISISIAIHAILFSYSKLYKLSIGYETHTIDFHILCRCTSDFQKNRFHEFCMRIHQRSRGMIASLVPSVHPLYRNGCASLTLSCKDQGAPLRRDLRGLLSDVRFPNKKGLAECTVSLAL